MAHSKVGHITPRGSMDAGCDSSMGSSRVPRPAGGSAVAAADLPP